MQIEPPLRALCGLLLLSCCQSRGGAPAAAGPSPLPSSAARANTSLSLSPDDSVRRSPPSGDAPTALRERLHQPLSLYVQVIRGDQLECDERLFSNAKAGGATFQRSDQNPHEVALLPGGISSLVAPGMPQVVHGNSPESLIIDGGEWFYSREGCLSHRGRYPPVSAETTAYFPDIGSRIEQTSPNTWYRNGDQTALAGSHSDVWFQSSGGSYRARFYPGSPIAWLRGSAPGQATRDGLYRAALGADFFQIGPETFCSQQPHCSGERLPAVPLVAGQSSEAVVDFAEQFWAYPSDLYVPLRDTGGTSCKPLHAANGKELPFASFGQQVSYAIRRVAGGFVFGRHAFLDRLFWGRMGVHGRDQRAFWLNGSPWFLSAADCDAEKAAVKPANFRAPGMVYLTDTIAADGKLRIESHYFALQREAADYACREVTFQPQLAGGRVSIATASSIETHDYDFYVDEWAFWFGPALNDTTSESERYRGHFVVPKAMPGGLRMEGTPWYENKPACLKALAKQNGAKRP